jgi:BirA family biotin operon repressor/biotin-[acetyl-CoA-carboxylase] ligase
MRALTLSVLRLLSEHEFRSGQALASRLNISRASVWGALNEAQAAGLRIQRVHGRGYRLPRALDWLDEDAIARRLGGTGITLQVVPCVESTNSALLSLAETGAASGLALAAEVQTRGRGRLGRAWHSGIAGALTFSLLWRFERGVSGLAGLSLAVGVAVARVLNREGVAVGLKWPNDVLWQGRKLGGILIEVRGDSLGPCAAVIGIGLNVRLDAADRKRIDQATADFSDALAPPLGRSRWLAALLAELAATLTTFAQSGFAPFRGDWIGSSMHQGEEVHLRLPDGRSVRGVSRGVDEQGRLLVDTGERLETYLSGEVSMRVEHDPRD